MAPRGTTPCFSTSQGSWRHSLGKGDFSLDLRVGPFEFLVEICGDLFHLAAFHLDPELLGHFFKFRRVFDLVVLDVTIDHFPEEVQHAHAVIVWAAPPQATMRPKFLDWIVSIVAPQTPTLA